MLILFTFFHSFSKLIFKLFIILSAALKVSSYSKLELIIDAFRKKCYAIEYQMNRESFYDLENVYNFKVCIAKCCLSGSLYFQLAIIVNASSGPFHFFEVVFSIKGFKL